MLSCVSIGHIRFRPARHDYVLESCNTPSYELRGIVFGSAQGTWLLSAAGGQPALREYGGLEITELELLQMDGATDILVSQVPGRFSVYSFS